mgnify:CR=1 FL=1
MKESKTGINRIIKASIFVILIPFAVVAGQDIKNEQRIKIVIAGDDGSKVILDTLITGNSVNDSIVLKNGNTIYLSKDDKDNEGRVTKKYIVTTSSSDQGDGQKEIKKEITIISSDSDVLNEQGNDNTDQAKCESLVSAGKYPGSSDTSDSNSEKTKYVINRDGVLITVEGSDYARVKEIIKDIEKALDTQDKGK